MTNEGGWAHEPTSYRLEPPVTLGQQDTGGKSGPEPAVSPALGRRTPTQVVHPESDPQDQGRSVGGRYRLVSRLGHGGMGTVWKAHDRIVGRDVAVKEPRLPDHIPEREKANVYTRMEREARAAATIDHPCVVTVHDVVIEDGRPWLVMELVNGSSLGDRLAEGTLDTREAARIGLAVHGALAAAHEAGVLHRDVKPDNVLLGRYDRVVLTDFGIAQIEGEQRLTEAGGFVGSPEFIAPERVLGQLPGPESDWWSLGVMLYLAVEGVSPFRRANTPATLQAVLSADPAPPSRGAGALGHLIMQLLRKDPAARPGPHEIRQILENAARPPQPAPTLVGASAGGSGGGVLRTLRTSRTAQWGAGGGGLLAAALVLGLVLVDPFASDGPPEGWVVRQEGEVVNASLAVPKDYRRTVDDDNSYVTFADPSGVFKVTLRKYTEDDQKGAPFEELPKLAEDRAEFYRKGAESSMEEVSSKVRETTHQGRPAAEIVTTYRAYGSDDDDITFHQIERLYANEEEGAFWRLKVVMPAEGDARPNGERLYRDIARSLQIQDL
ncbi:serine/threonine-protein kinase [Streptomyces pacificus]|uniref:non-specific serine/threonine protein kinase n=1 Tax=Streptomyces pacificus TaxID=2705029 RepID=A0A6A0AU71_9ACTN|nr:serine/threonine-protein kinase [Streptomyces pacificus]GFH36005.1 serine/threonine protein kinase [Streptomyces pacificus]